MNFDKFGDPFDKNFRLDYLPDPDSNYDEERGEWGQMFTGCCPNFFFEEPWLLSFPKLNTGEGQ
jgi:hypothetical protein